MPPHKDPYGWLTGKHDQNTQCRTQSHPYQFEIKTMQGMCSASVDKNGFIMSYQKAYDIVASTYSGFMSIDDELQVSDWQGAKKYYHAKGLGINPEDYEIIQKELNKIRGKGGLIGYIQRGGKLPPIELVRAYQTRLKEICYDPSTIKNEKATYTDANGVRPATIFSNKKNLNLISFDQTTNK